MTKNLHSDITILRQAMLFSLTRRVWSNRQQADKVHIQTTGDKKKLNLTKQLLNSPELDAINEHLNEVYKWSLNRAMPSTTIRRGIYFVKQTMISEFEARLIAAQRKLRDVLVPAFIRTYPLCVLAMRQPAAEGGLGDLFEETDYPSIEELSKPDVFSIEWSWLALSVPDELPEEVREREVKKLRDSFKQAQEEIRWALREAFKQLVDHAVERLTPGPDGKVKEFRNSLVTNFEDFFDTFHARDLMDDAELQQVVAQAREIVRGLPDPKKLRQQADLQYDTAKSFAKVGKVLDTMVATKPTRLFDLE